MKSGIPFTNCTFGGGRPFSYWDRSDLQAKKYPYKLSVFAPLEGSQIFMMYTDLIGRLKNEAEHLQSYSYLVENYVKLYTITYILGSLK